MHVGILLARRSYGQVRKVKLASVSIRLLHPFISSHHASSCHTALPWSLWHSTSWHSMFQESRSKAVWKYARTWTATQPEPAKMTGLHSLRMVEDARLCWNFPRIYSTSTRIYNVKYCMYKWRSQSCIVTQMRYTKNIGLMTSASK